MDAKVMIQKQQVFSHCDPCNPVYQSVMLPNKITTLAFSMEKRYVLCESDLDELGLK